MFVHILLATSVVAATFAAPTSPPIVTDEPIPMTSLGPSLKEAASGVAISLSPELRASRPARTLAWVSAGSKTPASTAKLVPVIESLGTPIAAAAAPPPPPLQVNAYAYAVPGLLPVGQPVVSSSYSIEQHGYHITY